MLAFIRKNTVMVVALFAAIITSIIILPDAEYASYFDYKTLACLFCTLAVVCALKEIQFFYATAQRVVKICANTRVAVIALVYITFIGSMLMANDMALITFLPLGYFVLKETGKEKYMAFTFVIQDVSANLGGMLTPFGNPQNLYLYTKFNIPTGEFMQIMFLPFVVAIILITTLCFLVKTEPIQLHNNVVCPNKKRTITCLVLFAVAIASVLRIVPYTYGTAFVVAVLLFAEPNALKNVDYPLLLTFVFFFIFAGNMSRIEPVRAFCENILNKNTLLVSVASCQFISNVPSAILLSQFTMNYRELLWGVNLGGLGTPIASLASLITLREYGKCNNGQISKYIRLFLAINFGLLIILVLIMQFAK